MKKIALITLALAAFFGATAFAYADDGMHGDFGMPPRGDRGGEHRGPGAWLNFLFQGNTSPGAGQNDDEGDADAEDHNPMFHDGGKSGENPMFEGRNRMRESSSTDDHGRKDFKNGLVVGRGFPGLIKTLGTNSFSLETQKGGATTTLTVNVDSHTQFRNGTSTTASFASLTVGAHVLVLGTLSTSTNSVLAEAVNLNAGMPREDHGMFERGKRHDDEGDRNEHGGGDNNGEHRGRGMGGFLQSLRELFMHENASSTASTTAGAGTPPSRESIVEFFKHLFGGE